jgi:hypothetical protein
MTAMPALNLSNTAPTTVLFTHGGLVTALLLYLSPWKSKETVEPDIEPPDDQSRPSVGELH